MRLLEDEGYRRLGGVDKKDRDSADVDKKDRESADYTTSIRMDKIEINTATQMAKFMWRTHAMPSTRAWTPIAKRQDTDVELTIKLRPWHALPTEAQRD
jgi:hypothetical protein